LIRNVGSAVFTVSLKEEFAKKVGQSYTYEVQAKADGGAVATIRRTWSYAVGVVSNPEEDDGSDPDAAAIISGFGELWPAFDRDGSGTMSKVEASQMYKYLREASLWEY